MSVTRTQQFFFSVNIYSNFFLFFFVSILSIIAFSFWVLFAFRNQISLTWNRLGKSWQTFLFCVAIRSNYHIFVWIFNQAQVSIYKRAFGEQKNDTESYYVTLFHFIGALSLRLWVGVGVGELSQVNMREKELVFIYACLAGSLNVFAFFPSIIKKIYF